MFNKNSPIGAFTELSLTTAFLKDGKIPIETVTLTNLELVHVNCSLLEPIVLNYQSFVKSVLKPYHKLRLIYMFNNNSPIGAFTELSQKTAVLKDGKIPN